MVSGIRQQNGEVTKVSHRACRRDHMPCRDLWLYVFRAGLATRGLYSDPAGNPSRKKDVGS